MPAYFAHGTTCAFNSDLIGGLTSIGFPEQAKEQVEITSHDSQGWREFVPGLRDGGTITLTARHIPEDVGQVALWNNFNDDGDVAQTVDIVTPPAYSPQFTFTFQAFVLSTAGGAPFDGPGEVSFVLKISGAISFTGIN